MGLESRWKNRLQMGRNPYTFHIGPSVESMASALQTHSSGTQIALSTQITLDNIQIELQ